MVPKCSLSLPTDLLCRCLGRASKSGHGHIYKSALSVPTVAERTPHNCLGRNTETFWQPPSTVSYNRIAIVLAVLRALSTEKESPFHLSESQNILISYLSLLRLGDRQKTSLWLNYVVAYVYLSIHSYGSRRLSPPVSHCLASHLSFLATASS